MGDQLMKLEVEDGIAVLTNDRPEKHNAANDEMDRQLFAALEEIHARSDLRVVLWRGEGKSFSSGRDTTEIGVRNEDITNFEFIERGHRRTQMIFSLPGTHGRRPEGLGDRGFLRACAARRYADCR